MHFNWFFFILCKLVSYPDDGHRQQRSKYVGNEQYVTNTLRILAFVLLRDLKFQGYIKTSFGEIRKVYTNLLIFWRRNYSLNFSTPYI